MRSHSHEFLRNELNRILRVYRPDLVQIEYVELALLSRRREGRTPWILTLHDVLLSGVSCQSLEDNFERKWIAKVRPLNRLLRRGCFAASRHVCKRSAEWRGNRARPLHSIGGGFPFSPPPPPSFPAPIGRGARNFSRGAPPLFCPPSYRD